MRRDISVVTQACLWFALICNSQAALGSDVPADVQEAERAVFEARSALKSGRFQLRRRSWVASETGQEWPETVKTALVTFRGASVKIVRPREYGTRDVHILHNGAYSHRTLSPDPTVQTAAQVRYGNRVRDARVYDPRLIGMFGSQFASIYALKFRDGIGILKRTSASLTTETVDGRMLQHIRSVRPPVDGFDRGVSVWIDPARGPSIVRVRFDEAHQQQRVVDETSFQLQQFGDVWFPVRIDSRRTATAAGLTQFEEVRLTDVELNIEIDDEEFGLAQLEPAYGQPFFEDPPPHPVLSRQWNGHELELMVNHAVADVRSVSLRSVPTPVDDR